MKLRRSAAFRARREKGQAALEFLLVFPIFFLFLLLVVEVGALMFQYVSVANAVRDAARYGSVTCPADSGCSETVLQQRAADRSGGVLAPGEVTAGWPDGSQKGAKVIVKASSHNYDFIFFPGISVPVSSCAVMRLEQNDPGSPAGSLASC